MKQKAFTLAEVLVVISIIGLLGSIVVVATRGAIERAKIAKVLQFSDQIHNALGADSVGEWGFNEGEDGTCVPSGDVCDGSGYGNNGTFNNPNHHWEDNPIPQLGKAVCLASGAEQIIVPDSSGLDGMNSLTVQFWFNITDSIFYHEMIHKPGSYRVAISTSGIPEPRDNLMFIIDRTFQLIGWFEYTFETGRWYHFAGTYYGGTESVPPRMKMYLDGELKKDITFDSYPTPWPVPVPDSSDSLWLGAFISSGCIDSVRIYEGEFASAQIEKLYVEGLESHQDLAKNK